MKYATAVSKRRKSSKKPKSKVSGGVGAQQPMLPNHSLVEKGNYRGLHGEDLVRDYQYPQTIYNLFRHQEREKFARFIENLDNLETESLTNIFKESIKEGGYSKDGCLRWVYDHKFFNDGQDRYEAADDVSFDVRSNFCARCELARRLVELHPIAYETPEEHGPKPELSTDGYTTKSWEWISEEQVFRARRVKDVVEISKDMFRDLLIMIQASGGYSMLRDVAGSFPCGGRRTYIMEKINNDHGMESIDYQNDVARSLRDLETPKEIEADNRKVEVSIMVSEINPFVTNVIDKDSLSNDQCFYGPNLKINTNSNVIHSMSISIRTERGDKFLFVCPSHPLNDYGIIQELDYFPDIEVYYPAVFYGRRGLGEIMLYSVMYLMEEGSKGEFSTVVQKEPLEFYKICRGFFDKEDSESLRQRLILHKRNETLASYPRSLRAFRNSLLGLKLVKQKQEQ